MAERRRRLRTAGYVTAILGLLAAALVTLVTAGRPAPDRVQELAAQLRCPVCKSVSVAESPSDTATAMRQIIIDQVAAGRSDAEIVGFFRARYGDWVWLDPPARGTGLLLWLLPLVAVLSGAAVVTARVQGRAGSAPIELAPSDQARVDAAVARARASTGRFDEEGP